jgi:cytochrome P450
MVGLSDPEAVRHLFYRKSALFADRPIDEQWIRATDNEMMVMMPHGPIWKSLRKISAQTLSAKYLDGALAKVQEAEYAESEQWTT